MKTDDLISLLVADHVPVRRRGASRHIALAIVVGAVLAAVQMHVTLGVRTDLAQAIHWPMFWMKVLFPATVAIASFAALARLATPGVPVRASGFAIALPVALLWSAAIAAYVLAPPQERSAMVWGQTWRLCALNIVLISVPIFAAVLISVRDLAPTRLAMAGACAGTLAGAAGAAIYAFHCVETGLPFMAIWYVAGIALTAIAGSFVGPRILKW